MKLFNIPTGVGPGGSLLPPPPTNAARPLNQQMGQKDDWGDFESFESTAKQEQNGAWVQF